MTYGPIFAVVVALNLTELASGGPLPTDHIDKHRVCQTIPLTSFFLRLAQIYHIHQIEMGCQSHRAFRRKPRRTGADLPKHILFFKFLVFNAHPMDP